MELLKLLNPSKSRPDLSLPPQDQPKKSCLPRFNNHAGKYCSGLQAGAVSPDRKELAATLPSPDRHLSTATAADDRTSLHRLPSCTVREMEEVFAQFDVNSDGKISVDELCRVLRSLGLETTTEEAVQMVQEVDANGDGFIDMQEFVKVYEELLQADKVSHDDLMRATFDVFDLNKDGHITAQELHAVLTNLGSSTSVSLAECHRMIRGVDRKGAGHVDIDDFKRMMMPPSAYN